MVTATNIVYSISATAQILGVAKEAIKGFQVWGSCVWVWVKGSRPRFLSFKLYRAFFVDRRKRDAEGLQVFKSVMVGGYIVRNPQRDSKYICTPYRDHIECNCEDYKNQVAFNPLGLSRPVACCKHGYATLAHLGYSSLREYIMAQSQQIAA
jgi:hypothetical protein